MPSRRRHPLSSFRFLPSGSYLVSAHSGCIGRGATILRRVGAKSLMKSSISLGKALDDGQCVTVNFDASRADLVRVGLIGV